MPDCAKLFTSRRSWPSNTIQWSDRYAGLSPRRHGSGKTVHEKGRLSKIGNAGLRKALYMPAIVAIKHNPVVQEFAQRLRANGKCESVIIGAAMRKLLHIACGVLKHKKPFDPAYRADASKNFLKI